MRKKSLVLAALLAVAGICVMLWPVFTGHRLQADTDAAVQEFLAERDEPEQQYPELLTALQEYNRQLYAEKQCNLVDLEACEEPAAELTTYGIEDEIIGVLEIPAMELTMPVYRDEYQSIIGNCDTLLFLGGGNEPESLEFMSKLLGKETISIRTRGQTRGRSGSSSINYQLTGRELMTPDEIRRMPTREALLLIRGESPVRDRKYNIKKHPNYRYTQDGGAKPYIHNPPPAPDYALTDLPYVFRTLDDFRFLEDEYEQEKQEKKENRRRYLRERGAVLMRCYHRLRNRR